MSKIEQTTELFSSRLQPITALSQAVGDRECCAPGHALESGSGGMTFCSALVCWLICNELFVLAILVVNVSVTDIDDRRDPTRL